MAAELFHTDIITSILVKLPVASLLRFKSVSKTWNNLISSPHFVAYQRSQLLTDDDKTGRRLIFTDYEEIPNIIPYYDELEWGSDEKIQRFYATDMQFRKTANDLLIQIEFRSIILFSGFDLVCLVNQYSPTIYVCNPATHDVFLLPSHGQMSIDTYNYMLFGFAYLRSTNEYIVVRKFTIETEGPNKDSLGVEIFKFNEHTNLECPSTSSWRMAEKTYPDFYGCGSEAREGPFVNRSMHWLIPKSHCGDNDVVCIFSFDIDEEVLHKIDIPTGINHSFDTLGGSIAKLLVPYELVDFNGKLGLFDRTIEDENLFTMSLWVLQEKQNNVWIKYYTIEFDCLKLKSIRNSWATRVCILYMGDGELLVSIDKGTLYSYNIEKKQFIQVKEEPNKPINCLHIGGFLKESMFHIHGRLKMHQHIDSKITLPMEPLPEYIECTKP